MSEGVPLALVKVRQQRLGGGLADRDGPPGSTLAATDGDQASDEVEVVELKVDDLAGADRGLEHEPEDRFVAAMMQGLLCGRPAVGHRAGRDEGAQLVVGERLDYRGYDAGCLHAGERVGVDLAAGGQPGRETAHASWRMRAVPGAAPASSRPAIQELSAARLIGRWSPSAHQRR